MGWVGIRRSAVFFLLFFLITFVSGIHLIAIGQEELAAILWYPVNGFAVFIMIQELAWDSWELVFERFESPNPDSSDSPERTLQPDITISTNFKIATMVVVTIFVAGALGYVIWIYTTPQSYITEHISDIVNWYKTHILPYWNSLNFSQAWVMSWQSTLHTPSVCSTVFIQQYSGHLRHRLFRIVHRRPRCRSR